jgi:hypothetical protein
LWKYHSHLKFQKKKKKEKLRTLIYYYQTFSKFFLFFFIFETSSDCGKYTAKTGKRPLHLIIDRTSDSCGFFFIVAQRSSSNPVLISTRLIFEVPLHLIIDRTSDSCGFFFYAWKGFTFQHSNVALFYGRTKVTKNLHS